MDLFSTATYHINANNSLKQQLFISLLFCRSDVQAWHDGFSAQVSKFEIKESTELSVVWRLGKNQFPNSLNLLEKFSSLKL